MTYPKYFDPKNSSALLGFFDNFEFLKTLYQKQKLPKVLMLSGTKGSGKATLTNHLLHFIFDNKNYNEKRYEYNLNSIFHNQFLNNIFSNIIYLSGSNFKNLKIEDIRILKKKILQTSISSMPRFIIFDDVELFNNNSLNALLKIVEEPSKNNYFILINNKSKPLIDTIKSRCLDIKIILNEKMRIDVIESLVQKYKIKLILDIKDSQLSPGNFIKFNFILKENNILPSQDFLENLKILLNLYKKNKEIILIDMILFLTNRYFNIIKNKNLLTNDKIIENKNFVFKNINNFFLYNLNQRALLNAINNKLND
jgi:DNA polymerase-3 subunit delta'